MQDVLADIASQPASLAAHADLLVEAFERAPAWMEAGRQVVMTGMATSLYAWHSAGLLLSRRYPSPEIVETSEYLAQGLVDDHRPIFVMSRSGESAEIARLARDLDGGRLAVGVTEGASSTLAQYASHTLVYKAAEQSFCNTKSFTVSLAIALALAGGALGEAALSPRRWLKPVADRIDRIAATALPSLQSIAARLAKARVVLIVSRGHEIGVAAQAALDLQESSRIGAIPISGGVLRHGPMELLLGPDTILLMLVSASNGSTMARAASDVLAAGGKVVALANEGIDLEGIEVIRLPEADPLMSPFLFAVALQRLNVEVARASGLTTISPTLIERVTRSE